MKNILIYTLSLLVCLSILASCDKETTPEPVRIQYPDEQSLFPRDDAYYERLRAYKKSDHKLAFGWYGSWTAVGASAQSRLRSAPDSMDIISMWSKWHSLNQEQIADKAFVQQVKGTKVVFCISAKDVPEEFKEDGVITEASIVAYAKAWGKDSMDLYQYDGMDIDFETAIDHQGPLNTTPGLFKRFCEELSQYIGPKSGTGRLFLIDGNIDRLDEGIAELCDYGISQAYSTTQPSSLRNRITSAATTGWVPEQLIFTENFESLWQTGGANYNYNGVYMPSLLGMAHFAADGESRGFGAYHMEYEYGFSDKPYKYMRQAIQIANPAPEGDFSKNLVSIKEAGEEIFTITETSPGVYDLEKYESELNGTLSMDAETAFDISLKVDNSLVEAYNYDNYTEYIAIDPSAVAFSGPFHFEKGSRVTENPVTMTIANLSVFDAGKDYIIPVVVDFTNKPGFSANTKLQVKYLIVSAKN